jgi:hypothetical protein
MMASYFCSFNYSRLISVSCESPCFRKIFKTPFTVGFVCMWTTWILFVTENLHEVRCGHPWLRRCICLRPAFLYEDLLGILPSHITGRYACWPMRFTSRHYCRFSIRCFTEIYTESCWVDLSLDRVGQIKTLGSRTQPFWSRFEKGLPYAVTNLNICRYLLKHLFYVMCVYGYRREIDIAAA